MDTPSSTLETPINAQKTSDFEPVIRVMPAEFRGGKTPMTAPAKPAEPPPVVPVAPPPVAPTTPVSKKTKLPPALLIGGGIFLVVAIIAVVLLLTLRAPEPEPNIQANTQVNTPPVNTPPVNTPPVNTPPTNTQPVVIVPEPGKDSDSDGLTDVEEILYGADARVPDTDSDTYLDGNEVFYMYNPRGLAPSGLADAGYVRPFNQTGYDYTLYYPSRWTVQLIGGQSQGVIFRAPTQEFIQVVKQIKDPQQTLADWYVAQAPKEDIDALAAVTTRQGFTGLLSPDKLTTYLDVKTAVYVISYTLAESKKIEFLTTYQMMVNGFNQRP